MTNSLSGRFLILTVIFVMLAEIFIFVPSVARFREDYLLTRLERAQIASLALEADDMISPQLEAELLENATAAPARGMRTRSSGRWIAPGVPGASATPPSISTRAVRDSRAESRSPGRASTPIGTAATICSQSCHR